MINTQLNGWIEVEHWMKNRCFKCKKWGEDEESSCKIAMKLLYNIDFSREELKRFFGGAITQETQCKEFEGGLDE